MRCAEAVCEEGWKLCSPEAGSMVIPNQKEDLRPEGSLLQVHKCLGMSFMSLLYLMHFH